MNKIFCYTASCIPLKYEDDIEYFSLYKSNSRRTSNNSVLGSTIFRTLKDNKIVPSYSAIDFTSFAISVIAADKVFSRSKSEDGWTRMIDLTVAVTEPQKWIALIPTLKEMLGFLTGDFWTLNFIQASSKDFSFVEQAEKRKNDCVCLLSGGVDSLAGAIDLMASGRNPLFVSQKIRGESDRQKVFADKINRGSHIQWNQLSLRGREGSTRARSLAFFAFALLASSSLESINNEIIVPENGFISLNIPLDVNRGGSLSTKTTHPILMSLLQTVWDQIGIKARLILPFKYKTKGEVLTECADSKLLTELVVSSISCGKYRRYKLKHCGICVPCLVRRAAIKKFGIKDSTDYVYPDIKKVKQKDLISIAVAIRKVETGGVEKFIKSHLNFCKTIDERNLYKGVIERSMLELKILLKDSGVL